MLASDPVNADRGVGQRPQSTLIAVLANNAVNADPLLANNPPVNAHPLLANNPVIDTDPLLANNPVSNRSASGQQPSQH